MAAQPDSVHSPPKTDKKRAQAALSLYPNFRHLQLLQSVQQHSTRVDWSSNVKKRKYSQSRLQHVD